jgi:Type I restriction modification DNA specificity domain
MQAQLEQLEKNSSIEWQAFKIGELFEKISTNNVIKNTAGDLPATTATLSNNQIGRYISRQNATILKNVFSATANGFGKVFYQSKEFTVLQDSYAFKFINSNIKIEKIQSFIVTTLNKVFLKYDWGNKSGWERIKTETIQLPTTNGKIAFEFMEAFIATLQAERLATLQAYLKTTGLTDTVLTDEEQAALNGLETRKWQAFKIGELFNVGTGTLVDIKSAQKGKIPRISVQTTSNGILGYFDEPLQNAKYFENFLSVNFFGISFYHPYRASVEMKTHTLKLKNSDLTKTEGIFFCTVLNKQLNGIYSYGNQLSSSKLKEDNFKIHLPTLTNQTPDYAYMETFIKAMQKVVIKNVVDYLDVRINKTASVIK